MANRFPLILNSNSNQIQELAANDTLDLTGSGLNLTGITTLSTGAQLNLGGGTNINTGSRGDILFYNSAGRIEKLSLGATGKILKSNGSDLVYGDSGSIANVYYVSPSGTDASGFGGSVDRPFRSIKYASANIGTPTSTNPAILFIKAGTYEEAQLPIVVPPHTTIAGDSLRATIIKPASGLDSSGSVQNNRSTMFRMSDATVLQDLVMDGMGGYTPGTPNYKPESATIGGVYLGFSSVSPIIGKSPYIYNCTSFGNGATGALLDGGLHASGNRSMLFHTYTAVHSDGLGIFLKNNANAEMISTFTYYCTVGFAAIGGSKIRSLNSSNAYGEYAVYSAGFDAGETANTGTIRGTMLTYTNVLTTTFTNGEQITGGTSGATAYVVNVQSEPKVMYIVQKSGTFQASETVTGGSSGATATLAAGGAFETNQSGRILVTTFSTSPDAGDSLQFASTDGNAFQIQSVSSVTANSVAYHVLVFSTSRATPVAANVQVIVRKEFSLVRLTGHDFLQVGTGGTDTTNWPNNPSQNPSQADQVVTNSTDPGRVYYTATDELGNFYVGDQFKVDQATGNVTLDASAFNLSGLESLRLGSVGGLIGAAVGEFSTDGTLSQNSDTKVPTQKAVKTYVDTEVGGLNSVSGNFTVAGISTVTGTTHFTKQLNVAGVSTFHGNVNLLDGDRARFGNSEDLQIYHDSNHSYIAENGAGDLKIQAGAGSIIIQKSDGEEMIKANVDGAVELYQDDVLRLTTTTTGVSIGGTLAVSGNVSIGGTLTYEDVTNIDSVGIITARDGIKIPGNNKKLQIGASQQFELFHDGGSSYIKSLSGNLALRAHDTKNALIIQPNAKVILQYDGVTKFTTETGGVNISGVATATTFSGSGASLTNLNGSNIASGTVPVARIGTGTKNTSTFYRGDGTFATVTPPAITTINNASNNRIVTSEGGTTVNSEANLTFDGTTLDIGNGNITVEQDSSSMVTPLTVSNGTSGGSADTRLLVKTYANGGGDPYLMFDGGGTNFVVGNRYAGTTNNILVMGSGNTAQNISGIFVRHNGFVGINKNNPSQALDIQGNLDINGDADGVVNVNTTASNGAFMRFRKASSTDTVFHVGAAKGMIGSYPSVNDGAIMSQQGMMYLHSNSGTFSFVEGNAGSSGIDIVCRGGDAGSGADANNLTSPFIRFRDYPTGNYANATTCDDNNWAIGADDSGVSSFKIVYGGGANSTRITSIQTSTQTGTTAMEIGSDLKVRAAGFEVAEISDISGTSAVGSSTRNAHYDATPNRGTYLVHGHLTYRDGAPSGDPDQVRMVLQVDGSDIAHASILDEDSNNIERNRDDAFSALITVNGSQNVQVETYTTDPGDPGGSDYRYRINIYKLG